jgi:hypothetical protein
MDSSASVNAIVQVALLCDNDIASVQMGSEVSCVSTPPSGVFVQFPSLNSGVVSFEAN